MSTHSEWKDLAAHASQACTGLMCGDLCTRIHGLLHRLRAALAHIVGPTYRDVMEAALDGGPGFTSHDAMRVMAVLHAAKHGAVLRRGLRKLVGTGVIRAMLRANVLGMRPGYSGLARDVPREAWQGAELEDLITAATAMHLYAMRKIIGSRLLDSVDEVRMHGRLMPPQLT